MPLLAHSPHTPAIDVYQEGAMIAGYMFDAVDEGVVDLDGRRGRLTVVWRDRELDLLFPGGVRRLVLFDPLSAAEEAEAGSGSLTAPMPGKIAQVLVSEGVVVERGTPLVVMEAMKMEHTLAAPARGRILALRFAAGDTVEEGTEIVGFEVEEG